MARRSEQGGTCLLGTACGWCYKRRVTGLSSGRAIAAIITVALAAVGVAGAAGAERKLRIQTLLETRGTVAAFAQDGNRIVWANLAESCRRFVQLRDVRMRKTWPLTGLKGPTCSDARELGGIQPRMALTGRRALWAYFSVSNQGFHFSIYTAAAGDKNEREVVLRTAQDKEIRLASTAVAAIQSQATSLMPEMLLRDLTAEQAASLVDFLASLKDAGRSSGP